MISPRVPADYAARVFVNCPFDDKFKPLFDAIVFAIHDLGFQARHALIDDGTVIRVERIATEIPTSLYSLHDVSRVELGSNKLPRFNAVTRSRPADDWPIAVARSIGAHAVQQTFKQNFYDVQINP